MITPVPMELVNFAVFRDRSDEAARKLVELGVVHPVDIRGIEAKLGGLSGFQVDKEYAAWEGMFSRIRDISRKIGADLDAKFEADITAIDYQQAQKYVDALDSRVLPLFKEKEQLAAEIANDEVLLSQAGQYLPFPVEDKTLYSFLNVSTGKIEEKNIPLLDKNLPDSPHVIYPFKKDGSAVFALFIGLRRDKVLLEKVLEDVGWQKIEYPKEAGFVSAQTQDNLRRDIAGKKDRIADLDSQFKAVAAENCRELARINSAVRLNRALLEAKKLGCLTEKTAIFSGWVPREQVRRVKESIRSIPGISFVESLKAEKVPVAKDDIPVLCRHNFLIRPFEMLIGAYGIPRYGSIDPTVFVAFSFLLVFGAMFGDIGHGLVLAVLGLFLGGRSPAPGLKPVKALLIYAGSSAMVFGLLYGSFFGYEFKSLWMKPIENIMYAVQLSVIFGVAMISLGIAVNVINALRDRDYAKLLSDRSGLVGGIVYWAALGVVVKILTAQNRIPGYFSFLIFSGLLIIFLYPLVECLARKKYSHFLESFMESAIGLLELFMGYLANTVSFIRVAAFAMAHAGLFIAIFSLANIVHVKGHAGDLFSLLVVIFGNILVIGLEGLVVTIQSIRLNYYEFFSKFFVSGKTVYKPLTA